MSKEGRHPQYRLLSLLQPGWKSGFTEKSASCASRQFMPHSKKCTKPSSKWTSFPHGTVYMVSLACYRKYQNKLLTPLTVAFASATVLIAAALSPSLGVNFDKEPTRSSWEKAIQIMHRHQPQIASAAKGIEVLQHLRQYISAKVPSQQPSPNDWSTSSLSATATQPPSIILTENTFDPGSGWTNVSVPPVTSHAGPHFLLKAQYAEQPYYSGSGPAWSTEVSEPIANSTMMEGLEDYLSSNSLDTAWLASQDFGNMLNWGQPGG